MINWKNKPIGQLSEAELRQALKESVGLVLEDKSTTDVNEWLHTFSFGVAAGVITTLVGLYFNHLVW